MQVFISWSGDRSRAVAELLDEWIQCVLQAVRPWMSSKDIDRGSLWFSEITDQLKDTKKRKGVRRKGVSTLFLFIH